MTRCTTKSCEDPAYATFSLGGSEPAPLCAFCGSMEAELTGARLVKCLPYPSTPADRCPRCADTGLIRQGFGRQPKPCGCPAGTPSTPKEETTT
jgi:hypothetical protein